MIKIALIGPGGVGADVVRQLHLPTLQAKVQLVALYTSSRIWRSAATAKPTPDDLIASMRGKAAPNGVDVQEYDGQLATLKAHLHELPRPLIVIDCTSSNDIASLYPELLGTPNTHVVTPNKKAFSGPITLLDSITNACMSSTTILNEATVGAGLPIICTLKDLLATGDRIQRIEGVFSGTLSYIFNSFSSTSSVRPKFSEVVKKASGAGYTEPNPADDLDGSDVARKLCILARTVLNHEKPFRGLPDGFQSVETETLVPKELARITNGVQFIAELAQFDSHFDQLRQDAEAANCVLRYVGVIDLQHEEPIIHAGLKRYPFTHPFCSALRGSDNIVCFQTERYSPQPLVIQGPGAGTSVTAMGVVADVLRIAGTDRVH